MRILLIGDVQGDLDEGMKKTTHYLARNLGLHQNVQVEYPRSVLGPEGLVRAARFRPDVVHYVHGPTIRSFLLTKVLSFAIPQCATVMSAPRPQLSVRAERLVPMLKPDLMLAQSSREQRRFERLGCTVSFLPGGVSLDSFRPAQPAQKQELRSRYGIPEAKPLVLHIGHISEDRGVSRLGEIRRELGEAANVLIVGASTIRPQANIVQLLDGSGCLVHLGYVNRIEEYYQMADCYVFPGAGRSPAIELPLTVLEALACDLPVVTSRFGGIPDLFDDREGTFAFADTVDEFVTKILDLLTGPPRPNCARELVVPYGWAAIADQLLAHYERLVANGSR